MTSFLTNKSFPVKEKQTSGNRNRKYGTLLIFLSKNSFNFFYHFCTTEICTLNSLHLYLIHRDLHHEAVWYCCLIPNSNLSILVLFSCMCKHAIFIRLLLTFTSFPELRFWLERFCRCSEDKFIFFLIGSFKNYYIPNKVICKHNRDTWYEITAFQY